MTEKKKKIDKKHNTKVDWKDVKTEFLTTNVTLSELQKKYHVSFNTISKHCRSENWQEEKEKVQNEIEKEVIEKTKKVVIEEKVKRNERHIKLYDDGLDVIQFLLDSYKKDMERIKNGEIKKGKMSPYTMDFIMSSIQKAQRGQRLALNIENEEVADVEPQVTIIEGLDESKI